MSENATTPAAVTEPVLVSVCDGVAQVRLNRPPLHILDGPLNRALAAAIRDLAGRPAAEVRVVVLASEGGRAFSAGVAHVKPLEASFPRTNPSIGFSSFVIRISLFDFSVCHAQCFIRPLRSNPDSALR